MSRSILTLFAFGLFVTPFGAVSAQDDKSKDVFLYASYAECNLADEDEADKLFAENAAPVYDLAVKDGRILSWVRLAHHTGGKWRRVQAHMAPDLLDLMTGIDNLSDDVVEANPDAAKQLARMCPAHDDYVWKLDAGSGDPTQPNGKVSFSVYYICDEGREIRADEIFKEKMAPALDELVAEGRLTSWGWFLHWVGGKYRRLHTMSGRDHVSVIEARNDFVNRVYQDSAMAQEFTEICNGHSDYLWDVVHPKVK